MDEGITLLQDDAFEEAYTKFSQAVAKDPSNGEAVLRYSFLNVASIMTDEDRVEIMSDHFGVLNYPDNMDDLFSDGWLVEEFNVTSGGSVIGVAASNSGLYPEIEIPETIAQHEDGDPDFITNTEYFLGLAYNFVTSNPTGVNELYNRVVNDVLGDRLNAAINAIEAIPNDVLIDIDWDIFYDSHGEAVDAGWPTNSSGSLVPIRVGKAELLMEAGSLGVIQSWLFMAQAYSKAFPIQEWWNEIGPIANPNGDPPNWYTLPTPFAEGFLFPASGAGTYLGNAKIAFSRAVDNYRAGIDGILSSRPGATFSPNSNVPDVSDNWLNVEPYLEYQKILYARIDESLTDNKLVAFPVDGYNYQDELGDFDPDAFFGEYSNESNWPDGAAWDASQEAPSAVAYNFAVPYSSPVAAVNFLLDVVESGERKGEPKLYPFTITFEGGWPTSIARHGTTPISSLTKTQGETSTKFYAVKLKDISLGGTPDVDPFISELRTQINGTWDAGVDTHIIPSGSTSVYVPVIPPFAAYNSFMPSSGTLNVDHEYLFEGFEHTVTGSTWFAIEDMQHKFFPRMADPFGVENSVSLTLERRDVTKRYYVNIDGQSEDHEFYVDDNGSPSAADLWSEYDVDFVAYWVDSNGNLMSEYPSYNHSGTYAEGYTFTVQSSGWGYEYLVIELYNATESAQINLYIEEYVQEIPQ